MNKHERGSLLDDLLQVKWALWRLHSKLERGVHRQCIALADDAVTDIIKDMQPDLRLVKTDGLRYLLKETNHGEPQ